MFQKIDVYGDVFFDVLRREFYLRMMYTFSNTSQKKMMTFRPPLSLDPTVVEIRVNGSKMLLTPN